MPPPMHNKFQDAKPVFGAYGGGDYGEDEADAEGGVAEGGSEEDEGDEDGEFAFVVKEVVV